MSHGLVEATLDLSNEQIEALKEQAKLELARRSEVYFAKTYVHIESDDPSHIGPLKFNPWPFQVERLASWEKHNSEVWLKRRQIGASWLLAMHIYWNVAYHDSFHVGVFSKGEREVAELLRKVRYIGDHLPLSLRVPYKGVNKLTFANGNIVHGFPSTEDAGVGFTFRLIVADEAALHPYGRQNYSAYRPAIAAGGQYLCASTADPELGPAGFFYEIYWDAKRGNVPYNSVFTGRYARPDQGTEWFDIERAAFKGVPEAFDAFYPVDDVGAFVARSGIVFPQFSYEDHVLFPTSEGANPGGNPHLWASNINRYAGTDYGGGDPTAVPVAGVYKDINGVRKIHVYDSLYRQQGAPTVDEIYGFLAPYHNDAPFFGIAGDPAPGGAVINASLAALDLPAMTANNNRGEGLGIFAWFLENKLITFNGLTLEKPLQEFREYRWMSKIDQYSRDRYTTSTPADHHGDFIDAMRYLLMLAFMYEWNRVGEQRLAYRSVKW